MFDHAPPFQNSRDCATLQRSQKHYLAGAGALSELERTGEVSPILKYTQNVCQRPAFPIAVLGGANFILCVVGHRGLS